MEMYTKGQCEYLRQQTKQRFDKVRNTWIDCGKWALPHRIRWMLSQTEGERNNQHIVDNTHTLALRSYVAGFLEGNTSASRPWFRISHANPDVSKQEPNKIWLDKFTRKTLATLTSSNFYHAAAAFYYDFGVFNTGAYYIDEIQTGLHFHNLTPGSYYCLNNNLGVADVLVRDLSLTVKALVDAYGVKKNGRYIWTNFSSRVRKMYEDGNYSQKIDIVHICKPNPNFDFNAPQILLNKQWISLTYELGGSAGPYYQDGQEYGTQTPDVREDDVYLKKSASKRKPFLVGRAESSDNFEYGETGPTLNALGLIKSLNKKAIGKDIALDQMLKPAIQGPANLKKSYINTAPNSFIPLDAQGMAQGGLKPIFQITPAISSIIQDVTDLRDQVDKLYFADYLLYLTRNPKTRTATETNAVVQEQQLIIGPNLQSLNYTHNTPLLEFVMDYVLDMDPNLEPPPLSLQGQFLRTEIISVFAQAQRSADLPVIDKYVQMVATVGAVQPQIFDKMNVDQLCDIYADRLYLPPGLNNPQAKVDSRRQQAMMMAQRQQMMQESVPAMAGAVKDLQSAQGPRQQTKQ